MCVLLPSLCGTNKGVLIPLHFYPSHRGPAGKPETPGAHPGRKGPGSPYGLAEKGYFLKTLSTSQPHFEQRAGGVEGPDPLSGLCLSDALSSESDTDLDCTQELALEKSCQVRKS